jgi:hypothetical protein
LLLTDATLPGRTICTGTWRYGFAPALMVDPHPAMSAYIVGWNYAQMSTYIPQYDKEKNYLGKANI